MELKNIPYAITERYLEGRLTSEQAIKRLRDFALNTVDYEAHKAVLDCIDRIERISGI